MRRINGVELIETDAIGEVVNVNTKLVKSALNRFLIDRGLHAQDGGWSRPFGRFRRKKDEAKEEG